MDSRDLPFLEKVLKKWLNVIETIAKEWDWEDVPWGYTERALLSTFAAAIWKTGGFAFEEYSTEKRSIKKKGGIKGNLYAGRCDLYFKIEKREFVVEAKHVWSSAGEKSANTVLKIREAINAASKAVKKIKSDEEGRIAIVFAAPYIPTSQKAEIKQLLKNWVKKIEEISKVECLNVAWTLPIRELNKDTKERWLYPGIAILIKKIS